MQITQILVDERPRRPRIAIAQIAFTQIAKSAKAAPLDPSPTCILPFFECVETQVGERNRKKFMQAILLNGVTTARGNEVEGNGLL